MYLAKVLLLCHLGLLSLLPFSVIRSNCGRVSGLAFSTCRWICDGMNKITYCQDEIISKTCRTGTLCSIWRRNCHATFLYQNSINRASRVAQWSMALYRSASCATRDFGFKSRRCCSRLRPGDSWGGAKLTQRRPG